MTTACEDLAVACGAVEDLIAGVRPDHWLRPTPCTEWTVRDVVNQLVFGNLFFAARVGEGSLPERGADHLADDPIEAYRASSASLQDAFARPGVLETTYRGPVGRITGAALLQIRLYDLLAHGWDLAQATGIPVQIPDDLAARTLVFAQGQLSTQQRTGRFAEPQPVDGTASPLDRLAAFLGRSVATSI